MLPADRIYVTDVRQHHRLMPPRRGTKMKHGRHRNVLTINSDCPILVVEASLVNA